jgi:PAS domain S-box-containing protein
MTLAVTLSAAFGGLRPGLVATVCSAVIGDYLFILPRFHWSANPPDLANILLFTFVGTAISLLGGRVRQSLSSISLSEERLSLLSATIPQLLWTCAADGRCEYLSTRWVEYTGAPLESQLGYGWLDRVHPDDRGRVAAGWAEAASSGRDFHAEFRVRRHDGVYRWFDTRALPVRDARGRVTRWAGSNTDIEDRLAAERMARLWQRAFEQAEIAIGLTDTAGRFQSVNAAYANARGYTRAEVVGRTILSMFPPEWHPRMLAFLSSAEEHAVIEAEHLRKDGSRIPVLLDITAIKDDAGQVISRVAIVQDLTARKAAEQALGEREQQLRDLNAELESRVRERTAQLEVSNHELEAFAYSVSHDLRAPLRGIDGWSLALVEDHGDRLNAEARLYLARVRTETQRMGMLIDALLQLSRVGRSQLSIAPTDVSAIAHEVAARLLELHADRRIAFEIPPDLSVRADRRLLEIALTNLFENAVKFTRTREQAEIAFGRVEIDGAEALFVRDNGVGFDMAYADALFGPFKRLHRASDFAGTGIGLATVQRIVTRHQGRVWATAALDAGATFYFTLGTAT